ncbi:hypothetical protein, partial [Muribaculum intestinale]|uniref:hypothetical protein n=1 Tax=Muribaculum intestinale TaxID=1796646 RepID=UPI001F412358
HVLYTPVGNILRYPAISPKRKSTENQLISVLCGVLPNPFVIRLVSDILHSTELICSVLSFVSIFLTTNCTRHEFIGFP